jgi:hypothetical protein
MGPFMAVAPLIISAAGAAATGIAASNQASYQAEIANQNAKFAQEKANKVMADYATKSVEKGMQDKAHMGELEARIGSSGVEGTGTAKAVLEGQRGITKISAVDLAKDATTDWYGAMQQKQSDLMQANLSRMEAKNARTTGYIKAAGSLMSGASKMEEMGYFS